jgi:glycosyltransferase involved in cell wall biosynthesis
MGIHTHIATPTMPGYVDTHKHITRLPSLLLFVSPPYRYPLKCNAEKYLPDDLADKIDIVHLHSCFDNARSVMKWARKHNKKVMVTVHTKMYDKFASTFGRGRFSQFLYDRLNTVINQADMITCPGEIFGAQIQREGIDSSKFHVVRNGVADWPTTTRAEREKLMLTDPVAERVAEARAAGKLILLFVGQHIREKNPHFLMRCLARLKAQGQDFFTLFVGGGDQTKDLMNLSRKLGIDGDVQFCGRVLDRTRLSMFYALADFMTFPSTFETAGLVVMEAAQHGLPTIGIEGSSGISEMLRHNENGYLAPLDEEKYTQAIIDAARDQTRYAAVRERAASTIARHKDDMVDDFLELYRAMLGKRRVLTAVP